MTEPGKRSPKTGRPGGTGRTAGARNTLYAGRAGEDAAVRQLETAGYRILERNYRCRLGEVDIVARDGDFLCFVEVKARSGAAYGGPLEAVERRKQSQVRRVATYYLGRFGNEVPPCRFDAVEVWLGPGGRPERLRVVKNAF